MAPGAMELRALMQDLLTSDGQAATFGMLRAADYDSSIDRAIALGLAVEVSLAKGSRHVALTEDGIAIAKMLSEVPA